MTQEDKELLLRDLCTRLPYGVKIAMPGLWDNKITIESLTEIFKGDDDLYRVNDNGMLIEHVKPYLFPLSSMTDEQLYEVSQILGKDVAIFTDYLLTIDHRRRTFSYQELDALFNWFDKNHFDYRGLIPMGLAIDATGLNIY